MVGALSLVTLCLTAPPDNWLEFAVPLPREAAVQGESVVPPGQLTLVAPADLGPPAAGALAELVQAVAKAGAPPLRAAKPGTGPAIIVATPAALGGAAAALKLPDFATLPWPEQAYAIRSAPGGRLYLVAPGLLGLRYALTTLRQLIAAALEPGQVHLPNATVTDWPALGERGFWGGDAYTDLAWLSERKYNLVELHAELGFDAQGNPTATMKSDVLDAAAARGITIVPIIHHLEQLEGTGIFNRHPELDAGVDPRNAQLHYFKLEHPALRDVLGKWFSDLARYPSVQAITVWLSEDAGKHQLSDPAKNDFVVEAELMQAALDIARKVKPELRLRLLLTQASYASNDQVLAVARPDTQIIYYDGSRTYNSTKAPMMPDNLKRYAAAGGWLGVCPQLIPEWRGVAPWHGGEFIQYRMREFAEAGVKTLVGYAPPARRYSEFNLEAAAEWGWNPAGREPKGFAHAYAVRRHRPDAGGFAEWATTLGPVAWDLYGSRVIVHWCYGSSVPSVLDGSFRLGQGVLQQLPDEARLTADEGAAERARQMAIGLGDPQLVHESVAVGSWLKVLHDMLGLAALLPKAKDLTDAQRAEVQRLLADVDQAAERTAKALTDWGAGVDAAVGQTPQGRASDTVNCVLDEARDLAAAGEKLGFPDTRKAFRRAKIGGWDTAEFDRESPIDKTIEVTDRIGGVGHYEVEFAYTAGLLGLVAQRAALVAQTGDDERSRQEVAVDEHRSHCGAWNENNLYHVELKEAPAGRRYFLMLKIQGGNPPTPREQRTTHGDIYFRLLEPQP